VSLDTAMALSVDEPSILWTEEEIAWYDSRPANPAKWTSDDLHRMMTIRRQIAIRKAAAKAIAQSRTMPDDQLPALIVSACEVRQDYDKRRGSYRGNASHWDLTVALRGLYGASFDESEHTPRHS
jgi:hypothetical protein